MTNTPVNIPHQNPSEPRPERRLPPPSIINASDGDLEGAIGLFERCELFGGALVIFGVAATVLIAILHPSYDSWLERWGSAASDCLVAIGVAIEVRAGQAAGLRHRELQRRSEERTAKATEEAESAKRDANIAAEQTEVLRRENLELERAFAPRVIIDQHVLAEALKHWPDTQVIIEASSDGEARRTAGQLAAVVETAGWQRYVNEVLPIDFERDGIAIEYAIRYGRLDPAALNDMTHEERDGFLERRRGMMFPQEQEKANVLRDLLNVQRLDARVSPNNKLPFGMLRIHVGIKPIHDLSMRRAERDSAGASRVIGNISEGRTFRPKSSQA